MKELIYGIFGLATVIVIFMWMLAVSLLGAEILWWVFTGDFFHFVSPQPVVTSTF